MCLKVSYSTETRHISVNERPKPTFMENIARWRIIDNHYLRKVRLNGAEILDIRTVALGAMLAIISPLEILSILF